MTPQWTVTVPRGVRLPGLRMAAFAGRTQEPVELATVPFPAVTLFVDMGDAEVLGVRGADDLSASGVVGSGVVGVAAGALRVRARELACAQLRMSPALAYAVLDGAAAELAATPVALDAIWGADARRLRERIHDQSDWQGRFAVVESVLLQRCRSSRRVDPRVSGTWRTLLATRGRIRVDHLAADVGWDRKLLWSRFRSQIGITPKRAAALVRFDRAAHLLAAGHRAATVAADCGYADQSHLSRETTAIAGLTPARLATTAWLQLDPIAWPVQPAHRAVRPARDQ